MFNINKIHLHFKSKYNIYKCPICKDIINNHNCSVIGECGYIYHYNCINDWINIKKNMSNM